MATKGLGRVFNYIHVADAVYCRLDNAAGISFFCYLSGAAGDTYTLTAAKDASGTGAVALAAITEYFTCTGDGSDAWVRHTQAAASTVVTSAVAAQNAMCVEVDAMALADGFKYLKLASTGAGLVTAVQTNLEVERRPSNLSALGV